MDYEFDFTAPEFEAVIAEVKGLLAALASDKRYVWYVTDSFDIAIAKFRSSCECMKLVARFELDEQAEWMLEDVEKVESFLEQLFHYTNSLLDEQRNVIELYNPHHVEWKCEHCQFEEALEEASSTDLIIEHTEDELFISEVHHFENGVKEERFLKTIDRYEANILDEDALYYFCNTALQEYAAQTCISFSVTYRKVEMDLSDAVFQQTLLEVKQQISRLENAHYMWHFTDSLDVAVARFKENCGCLEHVTTIILSDEVKMLTENVEELTVTVEALFTHSEKELKKEWTPEHLYKYDYALWGCDVCGVSA